MPTEGLQPSDVDSVRQEVERAIEEALANLRRLELVTQQRLRDATVEQEQLDRFIEEMHYRVQFHRQTREAGSTPLTVTGPLSDDQLGAMQRQEDGLRERKADLQ